MAHPQFDNPEIDAAVVWQLARERITFGKLPRLMGILNVTPDSFSDGGQFFDPQAAVERGLEMVEHGADILDVGGESTRPYSEPVPAAEELRRVIPVIKALAERTPVPISIDTSKASVARAAVAAGAQIVNDVTALTGDPQMMQVVLKTQVGVCLMHMQGTPQTMQDDPSYDDVVRQIMTYLTCRRDAAVQAGLACDHICLDVGLGFGKSFEHNVQLMQSMFRFHSLCCPLLVGHSRKGFLGKITGPPSTDRKAASLGVAAAMAKQRVQILRVHDVLETRDALRAFAAGGGLGEI